MNRCQGESYCKQFNEERSNCHEYCIGYIQLYNIYHLSHMPPRYQFENDNQLYPEDVDYDSFVKLREWKDNVEQNVKDGKGVFLWSETKGNGKTTWLCKIMNEYFKKVALKNNLRCRGLFVEVPKFFKMMRDNMNNPSQECYEFCEAIENADLVIWDDIGAQVPTEWVREQLYIYINHRYNHRKSQLFTSNISPDLLKDEASLGTRTLSRIYGCCDTFEIKDNVDRRIP